MFGTLRIGSEKDSVEFIEHAKGAAASRLGGYVFSHSACERCRLKKLRCNKHKSGCDRCESQALKCSYQTAAENNNSRPKPRLNFQANCSGTGGTASASNVLSPLNNNGVDQDLGWWEMTEADPTGSVATTTSENELQDLFSNIAGLQPDDMETTVFMGAETESLIDDETFDAMVETSNSVLDGIGNLVASQPASADAQSVSFDNAQTSQSSPPRQNSDALASHDFVATDFGRAKSRTDPSSCQCQRSILCILAEIEARILSTTPSNMYAILSYQRQATTASNDILTSRMCDCRIQFFGILVIIGEKITSLSEAIITAFVCRMKEQNDDMDFGESDSPDKRLDRNNPVKLGEFQIQTLQEFKVISAAIIKLQLKFSVTFVFRIRNLAMSMNHLAQAQSLKKLELRLKELFIKMQRMASDVETGS